jgi:hypothetical protein
LSKDTWSGPEETLVRRSNQKLRAAIAVPMEIDILVPIQTTGLITGIVNVIGMGLQILI